MTKEQEKRAARALLAYQRLARYVKDDSAMGDEPIEGEDVGLAEAQAFIFGDEMVAVYAHQMRKYDGR